MFCGEHGLDGIHSHSLLDFGYFAFEQEKSAKLDLALG